MKSALVVSFLFLASAAMAQWRPLTGISGGVAHSILEATASGQSAVYAATENGIYRSEDHFTTWKPAGLQGSDVQRLATVHTSTGDILFAATESYAAIVEAEATLYGSFDAIPQSLWRSTDGGSSWDSIGAWQGPIVGMFLDADSFYVVIGRQLDSSEVWTSDSLGSSAFRFALSLPRGVREATCIGNNIIAIGEPGYTVRWGIMSGEHQVIQDSIEVLRLKRYGSLLAESDFKGLALSFDSGRSWSRPSSSTAGASNFAIHNDTIVAVGSVSTDLGTTWKAAPNPPSAHRAWRWHPSGQASSEIEYADSAWLSSGTLGLFASKQAIDWIPASNGIEAADISDVTLHDRTIFAVNGQGIWVSSDYGLSWITPKDSAGLLDSEVVALRSTPSSMYAFGPKGLWNWTRTWSKMLDSAVSDVAESGNVLFVATQYQNYRDGLLLRSTNAGLSWIDVSPPPLVEMSSVTDVVVQGNFTFAMMGGWSGEEALYVSSDFGDHWQRVPHDYWGYEEALVTFKSDLYVATDLGLWTSKDEGASWSQIEGVGGLKDLRATANELLAITQDTGSVGHLIRITPDGSVVSELSGDSVSSINCMDGNEDVIVAGASSRGLWIDPRSSGAVRSTTAAITALRAYPNPAAQFAIVPLATEGHDVTAFYLYNAEGKAVTAPYTVGANEIRIETTALPTGPYNAIISTRMGRTTTHILVMH